MPFQIKSLEQYHKAYKRSIDDPEGFWADIADTFIWDKKWHTVLKNDFITPDIQWYLGGKLNITVNCLDRHIATKGDEPAIIWESNETDEASVILSYRELLSEVNKCANALKSYGIKKGDRICFYMPMILF